MKSTNTFGDTLFDRSDFPLTAGWREDQVPIPLHNHTFEELVIIEAGTADHFVNEGERFPLRVGDVFVIKPNSAHGFDSPRQLVRVNIRFHLERLSLPMAEMCKLPGYHALFELEPRYRQHHRFASRLRLGMTDLRHALDLAKEMESELTRRAPGYEFASLSSFMRLIALLCRCYSRSTTPLSLPLLRADRAIQYLESHYQEEISLRDLGHHTHQSVNTLLRVFKAATGHSPVQYLLNLRLRKATELLIERPDLGVTEAALAAGFNDSNYFSRLFRRRFKVSPRAFRLKAWDSLGDTPLRDAVRPLVDGSQG
ncbi:MAG: AraC family transcriptional regulator [bacterium]